MAKLQLSKASYEGIKGAKKVHAIMDDSHDELVKEANKRIRENQLRQAKACKEAEFYFCK